MIGDDIEITIDEIHGRQVRIRINAPRNIPVKRSEIYGVDKKAPEIESK